MIGWEKEERRGREGREKNGRRGEGGEKRGYPNGLFSTPPCSNIVPMAADKKHAAA